MRRPIFPICLVLTAILAAGCGQDSPTAPGVQILVTTQSSLAPLPAELCGEGEVVRLLAGRTTPVGTVQTNNDESYLYVTYRTEVDWPIWETALYVGGDLGSLPTVGKHGNPAVGRFPMKAKHSPGTHEVTWRFPLSELDDGSATIAAFAEVGPGEDPEGAWGEGELVSEQGSWATWFAYELCDPTGDGPPSEPPPEGQIPCPDLSVGRTSGLPLDEIEIGLVPEEFGTTLAARVEGGEGEEGGTAFAFVHRGRDETALLVVPVHPSASAEGGAVQLIVTDGALECPPVDFTIDPLPPAPGEYGALVDVLQEAVRQQALAVGTTVAELTETDVLGLPEELWPLAVAQSVIEHPDNPNSMRAFAEGRASFADEANPVLLDRLTARTGLTSELTASVEAVPSSPAPSLRASSISADALDCLTTPIGKDDAPLLDSCMETAASAAFRLEGASNQALNDIGLAVGVAGVIPNPGTKLASAGAGLAIWTLQQLRQGTANLLPSAFVSMNFVADPLTFEEDRPGPGSWKDAMVEATSRGWRMDKLILDAAFQLVNARSAYKGWLKRFEPSDLGEDLVGLLQTMAIQEAINSTEGSDFVEIDPEIFGPVDVSSDTWSESRIAMGTSVELVSHTEYEPREPGISILSVRTEDGEFGGQQIAEQKQIEVEQIVISIDPLETRAKAGEMKEFTVTVENSKSPEMVEIDPSVPLQGTAELVLGDANVHTIEYTAPAEPDFGTSDRIRVRHTSTEGARAGGPERFAQAFVNFAEITISPRDGCVALGDTLRFAAEVEGLDDTSVEWNADVGDIDEAGLYQAPSAPPPGNEVTITARSVSEPDLEDSVTIDIGCSCRWTVTLEGRSVTADDGDLADVELDAAVGFPASAVQGFALTDVEPDPLAGGFLQAGFPPIPFGETGTFATDVAAFGGGSSFLPDPEDTGFGCDVSSTCSLTLEVLVNDGEAFQARLSGTVGIENTETGLRLASLSAFVAISYADDPARECVVGE